MSTINNATGNTADPVAAAEQTDTANTSSAPSSITTATSNSNNDTSNNSNSSDVFDNDALLLGLQPLPAATAAAAALTPTPPTAIPIQLTSLPTELITPSTATEVLASTLPTGVSTTTNDSNNTFDPNILASFASAVPSAFPITVPSAVPSIAFSPVPLSASTSAVPLENNVSFTSIPPQLPQDVLQTSTVLPESFLPAQQQQQSSPPTFSVSIPSSTVPSTAATNTASPVQPPLPQQQQQQQQSSQVAALSASAKFLQEQLDAQKAATASSTGGASPSQNKQPHVQRAALPKKQQQQQQQHKPPQSQQSPQSALPTTQQQQPELADDSTPQISTDLLAMVATGTATPSSSRPPASNSQQLQHDLQQLQLHRERQAAAEAEAAASVNDVTTTSTDPTTGFAVPNAAVNTNTTLDTNLNASQVPTVDAQTRALKALLSKGETVIPGTQIQISDEMISKALTSLGASGAIADLAALKSILPDMAQNNTEKLDTGSTVTSVTPLSATTATTNNNNNATADATASSGEAIPAAISTPPQIFKATYSGVPVFEMICRGVAVMRRRSDSYLNATQILKVAEFDKPQRTRILEREVQKGEHEKVQGGYGKYQGTWVPYERGVQLCQEYNVMDVLQPLLGYQIRANSPPLAPKHVTAATNRPRKPKEPRVPGAPKIKKPKTPRAPKHGAQGSATGSQQDTPMTMEGEVDDNTSTSEMEDQDEEMPSRAGSEASIDETMSILSGQSRSPTPSPLLGSRAADHSSSDISDNDTYSPGRRRQRSTERSPRSRKKQNSRPGDELFIGYHGGHDRQPSHQQSGYPSPSGRSRRRELLDQDVDMRSRDEAHSPNLRHASPSRRRAGQGSSRTKAQGEESWQDSQTSRVTASESTQSQYAETLLEYFVTDQTILPSILTHPPPDLDFDLIIDEEGHTPLHWAVAMARIKIVKLLVQHGADIYRVNNQGQTALMRSVLFANNFDMKTFASLLEILQKTIFTIDKNDQTVFHHVAATAGMRGKVHASRYYMECLLDKLALHPSELASIINVQDVAGDTALIIAARIGNKKVVRLLLEAGADSKIRNKSGRNADEFLQEAENQASGSSSTLLPSLQPPPSTPAHSQQHQQQQQQQQLQPQSSQGSPYPYHQAHFGHSTPTMRSTTPPLSRHGGYTPSMDRPTHTGFQDYSSSSSSSRNPFQPHSTPSLPSVGQSFGHPRPGSMHEPPSSSRGGSGGQGGHAPLDGTRPVELGPAANFSGSSGSLGGGGGGVRASQRMIPAVTELFEHLTQSYEKDLYEKEQDLLDARNLLHSIQSEVQEGHRTMDELRNKTMYLGQAEDQIRTLESMIRQEIHLRQRLRLEDLVAQEESRLRRDREMEKERTDHGSVDGGRVLAMEREAVELRASLSQMQQSRKEQVEQIVQLKSQQGKRRQEYKRLIALCCNVSIDEVDGLLGPLLNTLGNEDGVA
ncbi:hypothetical protein BG015_009746 [Linnemannia schmuckeri]|uniref:HTH APSES-type domain-containing protein n=1 Tax=Linnemannia schmuckeri TaxID=64567 RepID=A0A9P5RUZ5_9FUNG|nr:hypothetical protein BG015_009746 [Linnemannia schmuckeri]